MKKNNEALYAQIDQYLSGQLSDAEAAAMRQAMLNDAELAQEVELRRLEFEVSEALIAQRIRDQMQRLRTDPPPDPIPIQPHHQERLSIPGWAIAAMLIIAAMGVYWWAVRLPAEATKAGRTIPPASQPTIPVLPSVDTTPPSPQANSTSPQSPTQTIPNTQPAQHLALALSSYRDPDFETLRGAATPDQPFEAAMSAWQKKDWTAVLAALRSMETSDPQFIRAQMFRAHAQFKLKQFKQAAQTFAAVSDSRIQPWAEEADWYLLLTLLADGQEETAGFQTRLSKVLSDAGHPSFTEAEALKKQLKK